MREKIIRWGIIAGTFLFFILCSSVVKIGIALILTVLLMVTVSVLFLVLQFQITFSKRLLLVSFFLLCCILGSHWGSFAFFTGLIVLGIVGFSTCKFIKDPDYQGPTVDAVKTINQIKKMVSKPEPYFVGKGTKIEVGSYILEDPLIYVVDSKTYENSDASLLCLRRRIDPPRSSSERALPYWPRLSDVTSVQLGNYVNWLATGRKDPDIELGYVFIYFYGLERRVLLDKEDVLEAGNEIIRLIKIYGYSGSFRQYSTSLLIHLILLGTLKPSEKIIDALIKLQQGHLSDTFQTMLLGILAKNNIPIPPKWAIHIAQQDQRTVRSVVLERSYEEFCKLFTLRYKGKLHKKMIPKLGKGAQQITYHAASPTFLNSSGYGSVIPSAEWPTITGWKRQFSPVVKLFNECIEELKGYSRKASKCPDRSMAFESLPSELQKEMQHPQQHEWDSLLEKYADDSANYLIPTSEISQLKKIDYREKLTLGQSKSLAQFVESFGSSVEPDPRYTRKPFKWNDYISIIRLPDQPYLPDGQNYSLVSLIMPLAVEVSLASGALEEGELQVMTEFFKERFMLTRNDRLRLESLIQVTLKNGVSYSGTKKKLLDLFEENQRKSIGKFLVMIAGAVDGVCLKEFSALEKTFSSLGLNEKLVKEYVVELGYEVPVKDRLKVKGTKDLGGEPIPPKVAVLNVDKIRKIHDDSIEASKLLINAMNRSISETQTDGDYILGVVPDQPQNTLSTVVISEHLKPFFVEIIEKDEWLSHEINSLAQKHNVTVSAALEEINTWADENLGDFLIEEGTPVIINRDLLNEIGE